jgi:hypothetical protein
MPPPTTTTRAWEGSEPVTVRPAFLAASSSIDHPLVPAPAARFAPLGGRNGTGETKSHRSKDITLQ